MTQHCVPQKHDNASKRINGGLNDICAAEREAHIAINKKRMHFESVCPEINSRGFYFEIMDSKENNRGVYFEIVCTIWTLDRS